MVLSMVEAMAGRAEMRSIFEASIGFFSPWKERLEIFFGHNCVPEQVSIIIIIQRKQPASKLMT